MKNLNSSYQKKIWSIAKLYWLGNEKFGALTLLLLIILFLLSYTGLSIALNAQQGNIISALATKEISRFWNSIFIFIAILIIYAPLFAGFNYVTDKLGNYWRQWLTNHFLHKYLSNRSFYNLLGNPEIDNPDQRISEDIKGFTQDSLKFLLLSINSFFQIIAFSVVLWRIYQPLLFLIIIYGLLGIIVTIIIFGKPLVRLQFEQLKKEANFRSGLIHIRDNAESIAFYGGENQEIKGGNKLFQNVFENYNLLIFWQFNLTGFSILYRLLPYAIPPLAMANKVFSGELEVGKVSEAIGAFTLVFTAISFLVQKFESLTGFAAGIERLYTFSQVIKNQVKAKNRDQSNSARIESINGDYIKIQHLTLLTPDYSKTLFRDLSLELETGKGLLVTGASGSGKSSLLRAIAGLWNSGTGEITRPRLDETLFLPQRPYMTLGSFRSQLLYPNANLNISDEHLNHILQQVNLFDVVDKFGNLDTEKHWSSVLSVGEQQRIAFARILVAEPRYAMLDEATSALDIENEDHLYKLILNSGMTYISVGHRPTLKEYHHLILELLGDGKWNLSQGMSA